MTTERDKNESENGSEILFVNNFLFFYFSYFPVNTAMVTFGVTQCREVTDFIIRVRGFMYSSSREQRKITPLLVELY